MAFWEKAADFMRQQPGYISTRLHKAIVPWARFHYINIAEWESVDHFEKVMNISIDSDNLQPELTAKDAEQMILKHLPSSDHHNEGIEEVGIKEITEP